MPRVPTYDAPQVALGGASNARFVSPEANNAAGQQLTELGNTMQKAGMTGARIAEQQQHLADETVLTDALTKVKERALALQHDKDTGFLQVKGRDAFDRPDGQSLEGYYSGQLQNTISDVAGTLGNDRQRQAFAKYASGIATGFRGSVMEHEREQFTVYQKSVDQGVMANGSQDIALNWNNPQAVDGALQRIEGSAWRLVKMSGGSAESQQALVRKSVSDALKVGALAALDAGRSDYAQGFVARYKDKLDAADLLQIQGHIKKLSDAQIGGTVASEYVSRAVPAMNPNDADRAFNILMGTESGGRQFDAQGKPLTSVAGAVGVAQVMPGTGPMAAKLAGMQWDEQRYRTDPAYNAALGRAYFGQQIKDFGGDLAKAYAAYNAGPRWVQAAEERAAKAEPGTPQADWFWQLNNDARTPANREQTRNYVTKNMAEFNVGGGTGTRPTFADIDAALRADPRLAGNPERYKLARQEAERQFKEQGDAIKQRGDEAVATAMRELQTNGGRFSALPPAMRAAIPPKEVDNLLQYAGRLAKGDDINNPVVWAQILDLPPAMLAGMSKTQFLSTYGTQLDRAHLQKGYDLIDAAQGSGDAKHLEIISTTDRMKRAARMAGVLPKNERDKPSEEQQLAFGQFADVIDQKVRQFEAVDLGGKRKANSDELGKIIDGVVLDKVKLSSWGIDQEKPVALVAPDKVKDAYVTVPDASGAQVEVHVASIPADVRAAIVQSRRRAGLSVSERDVASYWLKAGSPTSMAAAEQAATRQQRIDSIPR